MQLFLLMILSAFMGGYYYFDSPALNLDHSFLSETIRTQTHVMCLINEQKVALDDNAKNLRPHGYSFPQNAPCAKSKDIQTSKFCMIDNVLSPHCYLQSEKEDKPYLANHYFISSVETPKNMSQEKLLKEIKKISQGTGSIGILFRTESGKYVILNPQNKAEKVIVPLLLIGANSLRPQQLIYLSHHTPLEVKAIAENSDREALICDNPEDIKVYDSDIQKWFCRSFESAKKCFGDMIEDANGCIPNPAKKIGCGNDYDPFFNNDAQAWECKRRLTINCKEGNYPIWTGGGYECVPAPDLEMNTACKELTQNADGSWDTVRIGGSVVGYPCNSCETAFTIDALCLDGCLPSPEPARITHPLCAGINCAYGDNGWIVECGDGTNCAKHKTIFWRRDNNSWQCV
ncbi:MAG: hypothetical protein ACTSXV_00020, partial [Alphaproteobacteria bacterium]